jgi:hypothetical protein
MDDDIEARVRALESLVAKLGRRVIDQAEEVARLRTELNYEMTARAIDSLTPWPTTRVVTVGR